ncbi:methyl-accepting chemotaxis protein [Cohnella lubricantis]|uniref:Methyl-accepting chemotaxis protein n=1 Tax=Cohnella lubricantis TaxID=2163172 RepID=A0A841TBQ6_9BACL|nr:methyl-accepting chemotaxis protein [Cohnella lubricantis]MBB6676447.1 methyl-accepting chemotaxis protein [Cohnella lubricantis]MBP2117546.1 methyl-accepting chemotaxis protein [Cohnella lubricantis]
MVKFGIVKKMVIGITAVSSITYGTSAFFLLVLQGWFDFMPNWLFVILTLFVGVFWTGLFGYIFSKWLLRPLLSLTAAAEQAAEGSLNVEVMIGRSDDELTKLSRAFDAMLKRFVSIIGGIRGNSHQTDLHAAELQGAIGEAARQIEEIAHQAEAITTGTERQSASAMAMRSSVEQLSAAVHEADEQAGAARIRARMMNESVEESEKVFLSLVEGMRQLAGLNTNTLEVVRRLSEYAEQIGSISRVVADFADQTNLLALNASIEAARAGEEGRGFVVVAQAVKQLAGQSSSAVKDIRELIGQIQREVASVAGHIEKQAAVAQREASIGEQSMASLETVAKEAYRVSEIVEAIAGRLTEQSEQAIGTLSEATQVARIAESIRTGAQEVSSASQEQTAVMQEIAASSETLRTKSWELREQVSFFKE